jgi:hypothetical protein
MLTCFAYGRQLISERLAKCGYDEWMLRCMSTDDDRANGILKNKRQDLYLEIIAHTLSFNHRSYAILVK